MTIKLATEKDRAIEELRADLKTWKDVAVRISNNVTLREFLHANKAKDRRAIYEALLPHLSFKPKPYLLIK